MDFNAFLQLAAKIHNIELPAERAHLEMAPPERRDIMRNLDLSKINARKAAVLMLIYPKDSAATMALIKRNSYKGVHSSQIAFPGGKEEPDDSSLEYTALRETEEEIGVPLRNVTVVRAFSEVYIPPSNFMVAPFLGYIDTTPHFIPDPREVSGMVELPLSALLDEQNMIIENMATSYSEAVNVPAFRVANHAVWGATAMMLNELKEVLKATL
ncbi:MAG TPA: CoA pyrophosphatase [Flavobacterium sp.]|jgi:8-oxo-dGTP pyrophosphatase MutT (NUDIX family)